MRHAEDVTFGGSGLDRAADLRGDVQLFGRLSQTPGAAVILLWQGKLLVTGDAALSLVRLPPDHAVLRSEATSAPILLGREEGAVRVAVTLTEWSGEGDTSALGSFVDQSEQRHPDLPEGTRFVELRQAMTRLSARDAELAATAKAILGWHATHGFCACCGAPTTVVQAGWQRTCPDCRAHHFPRTDPVVIMLITHGNQTLLGRSPGWPDGMYSCLAGFVEPGETIEAAVRREVMEEAGIPVGPVRYLASQPWPFPSSLMIGCQGAALATGITLDPNELEHAMWVTREEVVASMAGDNPKLKPARKGAIAHFLLRNWLADRLD